MISVSSFAKINLGLKIGPIRPDGFHELRTIYQTLALHDVVRVEVQPGSGIEIHCSDPRVPLDESNTCYKVAERVLRAANGADKADARGEKPRVPRLAALARDDKDKEMQHGAAEAVPLQSKARESLGKVVIEIEKRLPVQGGMGAASSNAVATMLGLERALGVSLDQADKLRIAAEVGSDLPLFLIGGTVRGIGRGEEVSALPDLPVTNVVVVTPAIGVSTPGAFSQWDKLVAAQPVLTGAKPTGTINPFAQSVFSWLSEGFPQAGPASGVPAFGGDRAETPLLDLVRAGIENDFERVVFPEYPELREVKELLQRQGAQYASLSGSGSTVYGLFASAGESHGVAERMRAAGHAAVATTTLTREQYCKAIARG